MVPLTLLITLTFTLVHTAVAGAERWTAPLPATVVSGAFAFDARTPFAAGARRGVRLAGDAGATVRAPCSGRVVFAGRLPRLGAGVSLRCGRLAATEFGLERVRLRRGASVIAGAPVGALGPGGRLWLAARLAADRRGYRDPLALLGGDAGQPLGPAPAPLRRRLRRPRIPPPVTVADAPEPRSPAVPLAAWIGAAVAGTGAGLGVTLRGRARRGHAREAPARGRPSEGTH